jgi:hypothetical protein
LRSIGNAWWAVTRRRQKYRKTVFCVRCHKVGGEGREVGPDLQALAPSATAISLESIVLPTSTAAGFESLVDDEQRHRLRGHGQKRNRHELN